MTSVTDGQVERFAVGDTRRFTWARCRADLAPFVTRHVTWRALAAGDIRSKYRRTMLGPWWITATNAITALIMGLVAGRFLGSDMRTYLPHFMVSVTIWNFISSSLSEACFTMTGAGGMIKAVNMPLLIHVMRMVHRNLIIFLHNIAVIPFIWLAYPWPVGLQNLLSVAVSMICVRYRDVPPVMSSVLQLLFFVSPIIWEPSKIKGGELAVALNPMAYLLAVTRDPIMGSASSLSNWAGAIVVVALITTAMAYVYTRYRSRVVYWA
jgi:lipopolysaccharide transport system permease protein